MPVGKDEGSFDYVIVGAGSAGPPEGCAAGWPAGWSDCPAPARLGPTNSGLTTTYASASPHTPSTAATAMGPGVRGFLRVITVRRDATIDRGI